MDTEFTFQFHDEVFTNHPYGVEITYEVTAQAVANYDYCPLAQMDVFTGMDFDILEIKYMGQSLPVHMPNERMFNRWIERVKDKARDVYSARLGRGFIGLKVAVHSVKTEIW